mmetsp:Transcript_103236/g.308386  ORF Transcript_103236/g.308386 Transcript_103236/m.308386 type:complete len:387 (-) Transcript_103236:1300-2460(-)
MPAICTTPSAPARPTSLPWQPQRSPATTRTSAPTRGETGSSAGVASSRSSPAPSPLRSRMVQVDPRARRTTPSCPPSRSVTAAPAVAQGGTSWVQADVDCASASTRRGRLAGGCTSRCSATPPAGSVGSPSPSAAGEPCGAGENSLKLKNCGVLAGAGAAASGSAGVFAASTAASEAGNAGTASAAPAGGGSSSRTSIAVASATRRSSTTPGAKRSSGTCGSAASSASASAVPFASSAARNSSTRRGPCRRTTSARASRASRVTGASTMASTTASGRRQYTMSRGQSSSSERSCDEPGSSSASSSTPSSGCSSGRNTSASQAPPRCINAPRTWRLTPSHAGSQAARGSSAAGVQCCKGGASSAWAGPRRPSRFTGHSTRPSNARLR